MKIAIIGSGIAGNTAAYLLRDRHDITVYEANRYVGGHTNTVDVRTSDGVFPVDTGFIVFNDRTYPEFNRLLDALGQEWVNSTMSFSVRNETSGVEYNGASLNTLFAQRRNALRPSFWRMIRDILRFNREAPALLDDDEAEVSIGDYLQCHHYSAEFRNDYLLPMAAAIWSAEPGAIADMPARFLVRFFHHHGLLQLEDRPQWRVIAGGSRAYVEKLVAGHRDRIRLATPVERLRRTVTGVEVRAGGETRRYDAAFLACHSDQALALLDDAGRAERDILGAIPYQRNEAVLHTDETLLPRSRRAWAAWNYHVPRTPQDTVAVTYNMNILQHLPVPEQYLVTLNRSDAIRDDTVIGRFEYDHPVFSRESVAAQARHAEINAGGRIYYCGAYWRNGFHEDGVVSAIDTVRHFEEGRENAQLHLRRAG